MTSSPKEPRRGHSIQQLAVCCANLSATDTYLRLYRYIYLYIRSQSDQWPYSTAHLHYRYKRLFRAEDEEFNLVASPNGFTLNF